VAEFLRFRSDHVRDEQTASSPDCPINTVSWYDAAAYCNWLSRQTGLGESDCCYAPNEAGDFAPGMKVKADALRLPGFRLPTLAEWELACRAGSRMNWSFGEDVDLAGRYAWTLSNSGLRSRPVRTLRPNDLGLFDCHGNVWEWCHDRLDDQGGETVEPESVDEVVLDDGLRPLRGGTFLNDPLVVGCDATIRNPPANRTGADGFRVARTVP
jgi:formylglycine-generating enzyme required for sulfatase activity